MDKTTLALFVHELRNQCSYVEASLAIFNQALEQRASTAVFFSAQSTLLAASQIGSILWPRRARARKRGEAIRTVLQLADKHPLNDKRLTALWEHADEKLEDWIGRTKGEQIVFDHLGPITDFDSMEISDEGFYRLYDPSTMTFYYRGDGYKIQAIADSISDIYSRVNAIHKQMFPEQHEPVAAATPNEPSSGTASEAPDPSTAATKPKKGKPAKKPKIAAGKARKASKANNKKKTSKKGATGSKKSGNKK